VALTRVAYYRSRKKHRRYIDRWQSREDAPNEQIQTLLGVAWQAKAGYGWHISNLKLYDPLKELSEFKGLCKVESDCCACPHYNYNKMDCDGRTIKRPPQSWCYVEEM